MYIMSKYVYGLVYNSIYVVYIYMDVYSYMCTPILFEFVYGGIFVVFVYAYACMYIHVHIHTHVCT